jgi:hypothetical protein
MATARQSSSFDWTLTTGTTQYTRLAASGLTGSTTTVGNNSTKWETAGTIQKLMVEIAANATTGGASTVQSFKAGTTAGNVVASITTATTGFFEDTSHTDTVTAGDAWQWRWITGTGGTTEAGTLAFDFVATTNTAARHTVTGLSFSTASSTAFFFLAGTNLTSEATEANVQIKVESAGTLGNLGVLIRTNARTTATTFTSRVNTAAGAMSVSYGSGATGYVEDLSHSDTVSAGALVNYAMTTSTATGAIVVDNIGAEYITTNSTSFMTGGAGGGIGYPAASTNFTPFGGQLTATATEAFAQVNYKEAYTLSFMASNVRLNSTTATSTLRLRKNTAAANQTISITTGATGYFEDTSNTDAVVANDLMCMQVVAGATGTTLGLWNNTLLATNGAGALSVSVSSSAWGLKILN